VPSMRLWDLTSGFGRDKISAGPAGGFRNDENVMRPDDYGDDYYDADYYGEDDYYDDYYDDGGFKYYDSSLSNNHLYCLPTREDHVEDCGSHHTDSYQGRRNQGEYKERSGSPSNTDSYPHYTSHNSSSRSSVSGQSNHS